MKVTYDPEANAMYIYLSEGKITRTEEVSPGIIVDYSGKNLAGIELLGVTKKLSRTNLKQVKSLSFQLL